MFEFLEEMLLLVIQPQVDSQEKIARKDINGKLNGMYFVHSQGKNISVKAEHLKLMFLLAY